jgi:hypothetical protein
MTTKKRLAMSYKVPRVTCLIDEDLASIKKINQLLVRLEKTDKDRYILEIINILRMLTNVFRINDLYLILYENIDVKYHSTINYLMDELEKTNKSRTHIVKKLQGLVDDE